ncbi:nitrate ABC transporter permease [Aphanizomenon flos-aquae NRERC-008]|jgi:nitrate/nitrite transport system permease protein|uniref:Nitrate ABC transporter permease n=2 Tax=Aphanizomenon flos-aquae TaxID=1176 RepID=A0ABR8ISJ1_APHFL|nr:MULTISPECIES: nitrate ABC transporter permease [Aphanizomenon]MBO1045655.1 nitrate ABC transporter permease [Aphanizomenon flos-aquae UKL13-PB]MBO1062059.1 nitrate ABC transporter permease [Aphanizomenon flos-aquae CP01]MCE2905590.1 nitrate ABC transporter permease [Anabaena sp. CoA2_C59]MDJ0505355.1 nitrate ABC transporter permease [Nostocales cyanobacterium LE14-WE12]OBQ25179.1 MAG: nitrate ABC transporter permease [Aphanizomenon flos-aquae LD13]OBQ30977.1 MAG: nitrate ABC transporter pe
MILRLNLAAIIAVASQTVWRKAKPIIFQDTFLFPALGCLGIILLWWVVALANHELMPTPPEALIANWDYILHPFYERGPGDLGIGWLLLASLRRVILGFGLGALVAIPLGFLIGMSRPAMLAFNPIIQIFKPVSPLAWLPISLSLFNLADPSAIFVIFITSLWPTIINTALGVSSVPKDYLDVAQVLEMPRWRQITKIILPASLPYIFTGLRISLGIAWLVIVAVEMLTGGIGIGFFVWDEWSRLNLSSVFLAVFIIGLTGLILDYAVGKLQELVTHRPGG